MKRKPNQIKKNLKKNLKNPTLLLLKDGLFLELYQDKSTRKSLFGNIYYDSFPSQAEIITLSTAENDQK